MAMLEDYVDAMLVIEEPFAAAPAIEEESLQLRVASL